MLEKKLLDCDIIDKALECFGLEWRETCGHPEHHGPSAKYGFIPVGSAVLNHIVRRDFATVSLDHSSIY